MGGLRIETPAEGVALVVLSRPERLNAFDDDLLLTTLPGTFSDLAEDRSVRAVVVTGEGRAFSAGADLDCGGFRQPTEAGAVRYTRAAHRTPVLIRNMPQPTIAAVNGPTAGAGFGLALACDMRFAAPSAEFHAAFVKMGLVPDFGVTYFLPRVIGAAPTLEMILGCQPVSAPEALRIGLVSRIADDVAAEAVGMATILASNAPGATAVAKRNVYDSLALTLEEEILDQEPRTQGAALHGPEFPERYAAWNALIRERRQP